MHAAAIALLVLAVYALCVCAAIWMSTKSALDVTTENGVEK
jgi:hypothetical protein